MKKRTKLVLFALLLALTPILVNAIISKINNINDYAKIQGIPEADIKSVNGLDLPITNTSYSQIYIEGNQIYAASGAPLYLAGIVNCNSAYSVSAAAPNSRHTKEALYAIVDSEGANLVSIQLDSELWESDPDKETYKGYIDTYVQWAIDNDLYFLLKLQFSGEGGPLYNKFATPGSNYKITLPANVAYQTRAINMWTDLATLYGDNAHLVGYSLLNEPYSGSDYTYWNDVMDYYDNCIGNITIIDDNAIFFVQPAVLWGSKLSTFRTQGYLPYTNKIVYEFHMYYNKKIGYEPWATFYSIYNNVAGDAAMRTWHETYVMTAYDDGYPVFCGEFGISGSDIDLPSFPPSPNYERAQQGQQQDFNALGIHYTCFYMRSIDGNAYTMAVYNGTLLNEKGQIWADNLPSGLLKPP